MNYKNYYLSEGILNYLKIDDNKYSRKDLLKIIKKRFGAVQSRILKKNVNREFWELINCQTCNCCSFISASSLVDHIITKHTIREYKYNENSISLFTAEKINVNKIIL